MERVKELERAAQDPRVPAVGRTMLEVLAGQLAALEVGLEGLEKKLMAGHRSNPRSRLLATIPGVGPIGALSFALKVPQPQGFCSGRHFAAWVGLTPRESSTGGRHRPGKISRQGDQSLRRLLVLGATAVIRQAKPGRATPPVQARGRLWLLQLLARKPTRSANAVRSGGSSHISTG